MDQFVKHAPAQLTFLDQPQQASFSTISLSEKFHLDTSGTGRTQGHSLKLIKCWCNKDIRKYFSPIVFSRNGICWTMILWLQGLWMVSKVNWKKNGQRRCVSSQRTDVCSTVRPWQWSVAAILQVSCKSDLKSTHNCLLAYNKASRMLGMMGRTMIEESQPRNSPQHINLLSALISSTALLLGPHTTEKIKIC